MPFPTRDEPWVAPFDVALLPQLVENMISIIRRDMAAACAAYTSPLPVFKYVNRTLRADPRFPYVLVGGRDSQLTPMGMPGNGAIDGRYELIFQVADHDMDPDALALRIQGYYWALAQMIWGARDEDWAYLTGGDEAIVGVIKARLNDVTTPPTSSGLAGYLMSADMSVEIQMVEEVRA